MEGGGVISEALWSGTVDRIPVYLLPYGLPVSVVSNWKN
jgi:hypothetical protein